MTRTICIAATTLLLTAAAAGPAHAQNVEAGVYGGWHIFSSENELGAVEGEQDNIVKDSYLFGLRVGFVLHPRITVEGEGSIIPSKNEENSEDNVLVFGYRAHAMVTISPASMGPKLFAVVGGGALTSLGSDTHDIGDDTDLAFHAGLGAKIPIGDVWGLRFDGRVLFPPTTGAENGFTTDFEVTIGAYKRFGDPAKPVDEKKEQPTGAADSDGDGLMDDVDGCVNEIEDVDNFQDTDGCPEADNDSDGILDEADACRDAPEDKDKFKDEDGCVDPDNDSDGFEDTAEACDNEAEDKDGFEDEDGCIDPDNDQDGVLDGADNCADKVETRNGFRDGDGCPDDLPPEITKLLGASALKGVTFSGKKATLKKTKPLDQVVKALQQHADVKLEIQGHTDELGKPEDNKKLSQGRADAVKAYLVSKGIAAERLTAVGYGADKPVKPGKKGGANRRIELQVITGAEGAPEGPREDDL